MIPAAEIFYANIQEEMVLKWLKILERKKMNHKIIPKSIFLFPKGSTNCRSTLDWREKRKYQSSITSRI
jgi:hypothetical protein